MQAIGSAAIHQRCEATLTMIASNTPAQASIVSVAAHFARRDTAPWACQSRIIGPKRGCVCR